MSVHPKTSLDIPKTQMVAIFDNHGDADQVKIVERPVVQPEELKAGEVLVKMMYSGVCHTDLHALLGDWPLVAKLPLIGGHEGAGYIVAVGANTGHSVHVGQAVGIKWLATSCLACEACNRGNEPVCAEAKCSGFAVDGTFQQYAVSYAAHVSPIPETLPLHLAAPILCAGVTVFKALKNARTQPGDTIVISGAGGGLGHLAIQYAVSGFGLRVVALDTGAEKRELCKKLGAEEFVDFRESKDLIGDIKKACGGVGPHAAIVAAAGAAAYEQALEYLRAGGTLVAVGLPPGATIKADVFWTVFRGLTIVGSYVGNREDARQALDIAARGKVATTYRIEPLKSLPSVYKEMHEGKLTGRVVLDLWK